MSEELIMRSDAIKIMACEMYAEAQSQGYEVDSIEDFMPEAKAWLNDAPSIDIVRCAECKWGKPYSDKQLECDALGLGGLKFPDDFCSYGSRSEKPNKSEKPTGSEKPNNSEGKERVDDDRWSNSRTAKLD